MNELSKICIRVFNADKGKWENLTLQELVDTGRTGQVMKWITQKILSSVGLEEGAAIEEIHLLRLLKCLEVLQIPVVKLK